MPASGAVVFDLDGVLLDSESAWANARREVTMALGGSWREDAQADMLGMSSPEWSRYMVDRLGVRSDPETIVAAVLRRMEERYREHLPLLPGAREAVGRLAARWPLGLASSANRPLIDLVLELAGLATAFAVTISSEEVPRGKPAPDVYLEAVSRLGLEPGHCAAVEDSANGIRSAAAAGLRVIAVPNREFPPGPEALALADALLPSLLRLEPELVAGMLEAEEPAR